MKIYYHVNFNKGYDGQVDPDKCVWLCMKACFNSLSCKQIILLFFYFIFFILLTLILIYLVCISTNPTGPEINDHISLQWSSYEQIILEPLLVCFFLLSTLNFIVAWSLISELLTREIIQEMYKLAQLIKKIILVN